MIAMTSTTTAHRGHRTANTALFAVFVLVCSLMVTIAQTAVNAPPAVADDAPPSSAPPTSLLMGADAAAPLTCTGAPMNVSATAGPDGPGVGQNAPIPDQYAYIVVPSGQLSIQTSWWLTTSNTGNDTTLLVEIENLTNSSNNDLYQWIRHIPSTGYSVPTELDGPVTVNSSPGGTYRIRLYGDTGPYGTVSGTLSVTVNGKTCGPGDAAACAHCSGVSLHGLEGQGTAADPVSTLSGQFHESVTDVAVAGRSSTPLALTRSYNSLFASTDGPFGYGWTYSWGTKLAIGTPAGAVTLQEPSGNKTTWAARGDGSYVSYPWINASLTKNTSGSTTYTVGYVDGSSATFDSSGNLTKVVDRNGYPTDLTYSSGQLSTVTACSSTASPCPSGASRTLTLSWSSGRVQSVTDPTGRSVTYAYNSGDLESVTDVTGQVWHYTYSGHLLTHMRDARQAGAGSPLEVVNTYTSGKVTAQTDQLSRQTTLDYSTLASVNGVIITDPEGNKRVDYYDKGGRRWRVKYGYNPSASPPTSVKTLTITYDGDTGGIESIHDDTANRTVVSNTYSGGHLETSTDAAGRVTTYADFNALHQPGTVTDNAGVTTTVSYDSHFNVTEVCTPKATSWSGLIDCTTNPTGARDIAFEYADSNHPGDVTTMTDPNSQDWLYGYDDIGNVVSVTDPLSHDTTAGYDLNGRAVWAVSANGNESGASPDDFRSITLSDNAGRPQVSVDANAVAQADHFNRPDSASSLGSMATPTGGSQVAQSWANTAGAWGLAGGTAYLATVSGGATNVATVTGAADGTVSFSLPVAQAGLGAAFRVQDASNFWSLVADPSNNRLQLKKTVAGSTSTVASFGSGTCCTAGDRYSVTFSSASPGAIVVKRNNTQIGTTVNDTTLATQTGVGMTATGTGTGRVDNFVFAAGTGSETIATYDADGNPSTVIDPLGKKTQSTYDDANQLTTVTRPDTTTLQNVYNDDGSLWKQIDGNGRWIEYTYDTMARPLTQTYWEQFTTGPLAPNTSTARTTTYHYDTNGFIDTVQQPGGNCAATPKVGCITYTYHDDGQVDTVDYSDSATPDITSTDYDPVGRPYTATDANSTTVDWRYDSLGQLISTTDTRSSVAAVTGYGWDAAGNLTGIDYPASYTGQSTTVQRHFDAAGRLDWIKDFTASQLQTTFDYDANNNLTGIHLPTTASSQPVTDVAYNYDNADQLIDTGSDKAVTVKQSTTNRAELSYSRDRDRQLAAATIKLDTAGNGTLSTVQTETYTYTANNQLQYVNSNLHTYDAADNLTRIAATGSTLTYNDANQPLHMDWLTVRQNDYGYDTRGNRTSRTPYSGGNPQTPYIYSYDQANRLTGYGTQPSGGSYSPISTYTYTPDGLRNNKTTWTIPTNFAYDRASGLPQTIRAGNTTGTGSTLNTNYDNYIYGPGGLPFQRINITITNGGTPTLTTHFLTHDQLGSTNLLLTDTGAVNATYTYTSYGTATKTGSGSTTLQYTGQWTDGDTGNTYLRARFYDTASGQFLTRDPLAPATRSPSSYAGGSPHNNTDPSGLYCLTGVANPNRAEGEEEVCNGAVDLASAVYHPVRSLATSPVTATTSYAATLQGGNCRLLTEHDWMTVCEGVGGDWKKGGWINAQTFGSAIITNASCDELLRDNGGRTFIHEQKHADQWALFGPMLYNAIGILDSGQSRARTPEGEDPGCNSGFEIWAGLEDGRYRDKNGKC